MVMLASSLFNCVSLCRGVVSDVYVALKTNGGPQLETGVVCWDTSMQ
jgi:hypothetical protein